MVQDFSPEPNLPWNQNAELQQHQNQNQDTQSFQKYCFYGNPSSSSSSSPSSIFTAPSSLNLDPAPASTYNYSLDQLELSDELSGLNPLGLKLDISPRLARWMETQLNPPGFETTGQKPASNPRPPAASKPKRAPADPEKPKPAISPVSMVKIGSWERVAENASDLVAKCYFAKKKLVWEILIDKLKSKIEIQWSDVIAIEACIRDNEPGILRIELSERPSFFRETNPQPRKHTIWKNTSDFTGGEASKCRRHEVTFPPGNLNKPYEKLLKADQRISELSQKPFPSLEDPCFPIRSGFNVIPDPVRYPNPPQQQQQQQFSQLSSPSPISDEQINNNAAAMWGEMQPEFNPNAGLIGYDVSAAAAVIMGNHYLAPPRSRRYDSSPVASLSDGHNISNSNNNNNLMDAEMSSPFNPNVAGLVSYDTSAGGGAAASMGNQFLAPPPTQSRCYDSSPVASLSGGHNINSNDNLMDTEMSSPFNPNVAGLVSYGTSAAAAASAGNQNQYLAPPQSRCYDSSPVAALSDGHNINSNNNLMDAEISSPFNPNVTGLASYGTSAAAAAASTGNQNQYLAPPQSRCYDSSPVAALSDGHIKSNNNLMDAEISSHFSGSVSEGSASSADNNFLMRRRLEILGHLEIGHDADLAIPQNEVVYAHHHRQQQQVFDPNLTATADMVTSGGEMYQQQQGFVPNLTAAAEMVPSSGEMYKQLQGFVPYLTTAADMVTSSGEMYKQQQGFIPNLTAAAADMVTNSGEMYQQQQVFDSNLTAAANMVTSSGEMYQQQPVFDPNLTAAADMVTSGGEMYQQQQVFDPNLTATTDMVTSSGEMYHQQQAFGPNLTATVDMVTSSGEMYQQQEVFAVNLTAPAGMTTSGGEMYQQQQQQQQQLGLFGYPYPDGEIADPGLAYFDLGSKIRKLLSMDPNPAQRF